MSDEEIKVTDEHRAYYAKKTTCPHCGSKNLTETGVQLIRMPAGRPYKDTMNFTMCIDCKWRGVYDKLKG